ncbi:MAG: YesL family protein [bacterium]
MLKKVFKFWFWDSYDNLGRLILYNVLWFVLSIPVVTLPAATSALYRITRIMVDEKEPTFRDFFVTFKGYFLRSLLLFLVVGAIVGVIVTNILSLGRIEIVNRFISYIFLVVNLWLLIFVALMLVYIMPCFIFYNQRIKQTLKASALLVLSHPAQTFLVLIVTVILQLILVPGPMLFMTAFTSVLHQNLTVEILKKYIKDEEAERKAVEGEEPYEKHANRKLRELIRPWE